MNIPFSIIVIFQGTHTEWIYMVMQILVGYGM
jgi:hypothetical protein